MEHCEYYDKKVSTSLSTGEIHKIVKEICMLDELSNGECPYHGNKLICDLHEKAVQREVEEDKTYSTAEMWLKAQKDNCIYYCEDMAYSKEYGFTDRSCFEEPWDWRGSADELMDMDEWRLMSKFMTTKEAEERFGIHILDKQK